MSGRRPPQTSRRGDAERFRGTDQRWQAAGMSLLEAGLAATLPLFLIGWLREHWTHQGPLLLRMATAAYGAFIIHPPVIVGLALALHQVAMPAELKLVLVLAGGIAGSFGITSLVVRSLAVRGWSARGRGRLPAIAEAHRITHGRSPAETTARSADQTGYPARGGA